jgi:uncharacterized protein YjbJ (UPF0337 family)
MEHRANTTESRPGSSETFEEQWPHIRGQIRSWWDRLSETDLEQVSGQKARLIRLVQEKYSYARERAEQEIDRRLREYHDVKGEATAGQSSETSATAESYAATLAAKAGEVGTKVQDVASSAATSMATRASHAGAYLQDIPGELTGLIRRHPIPSLLVGIGVGFLLGRGLSQMSMSSRYGSDWEADPQAREAGYPDATIQCVRCGELVRQRDMVSHSTTCTGTGIPGHGGSPT